MRGRPITDLSGRRFTRLAALSLVPRIDKKAPVKWTCRCDCGNIVEVRSNTLLRGQSGSCGCLHKEVVSERMKVAKFRHGGCNTPTYSSWMSMLGRCRQRSRRDWFRYGGRGIIVCDRWQDSFDAFRQDMGERPAGTTLDRIDNDGNYEPSNCRWAVSGIQSRNKSNNVEVVIDGRSQCLAAWLTELGISGSSYRYRVKLLGSDPAAALRHFMTRKAA